MIDVEPWGESADQRIPIVMADSFPKSSCLYCGQPTAKGKRGEHIIPAAIGGGLTLRDAAGPAVCSKCNCGVLSQLDKELCSRSYLSVVASQQLDSHVWQAWDVDHGADNLLVEARPVWGDDGLLNCLVCYPQIILERKGPVVRVDAEEGERFGMEEFSRVIFRAARHAFARYCSAKKGAVNLERIRSSVIREGYRLPPRIFTPHSIEEIAGNIERESFVLRFVTEEDKRHALQCLSKLEDGKVLKGWSRSLGSYSPALSFFFDIGDCLRGLMKIGLNLVAAYCPQTPVRFETFAGAIRVIRGMLPVTAPMLDAAGFVRADGIQDIKGPSNDHSFRLVHSERVWHIYMSFFGGRIGAYVSLPGPNYEKWNSADILAPIRSKDWTFTPSSILKPLRVHIDWSNSRMVAPYLKLKSSESSVHAELVRRK